MKRVGAGGDEIARLSLRVEAVIEEHPGAAIEDNTGIAGETLVATAGAAHRNDRAAGVALPGFEVAGGCDSSLFDPAFRSVRLRVVEEVVGALMLHQTGLVKAAA